MTMLMRLVSMSVSVRKRSEERCVRRTLATLSAVAACRGMLSGGVRVSWRISLSDSDSSACVMMASLDMLMTWMWLCVEHVSAYVAVVF